MDVRLVTSNNVDTYYNGLDSRDCPSNQTRKRIRKQKVFEDFVQEHPTPGHLVEEPPATLYKISRKNNNAPIPESINYSDEDDDSSEDDDQVQCSKVIESQSA